MPCVPISKLCVKVHVSPSPVLYVLTVQRTIQQAVIPTQCFFFMHVILSLFVHPELWLCSSLESVNASCNQIAELCPEVMNCKTLRRLCLDRNVLTSLPPQLSRLPLATELSFSGNRLESLPAGDVQISLNAT